MMLSNFFSRFLSVLLLVCLLMSLMPTAAFADDTVESTEEIAEAAETAEATAEELPGEAEETAVEAAAVPDFLEEAEDFADAQAPAETVTAEESEAVELPVDEPAAASDPESPAAEEYTLTYYNTDPYTGGFRRKVHTAGETVKLNEVSFSRDLSINSDGTYCAQYTLVGWSRDNNGVADYALSDTLVMPDGDLSLYAVWAESEQVYWAVSAEAGGSLRYQPMKVSPGSDEWNTAAAGETVKVYVSSSRAVFSGLIHGFIPVPADGYVFDGWYVYGTDKLAVETLRAGDFPARLTDSIVSAGANRIVARFVPDTGDMATVCFQQDEAGTIVYYKQMVKIGSATPQIDDPHYNNHYFTGWSPALSATVTGDVTYVAQWFDGPVAGNVASPLFTIRCTNNPGVNGTHEDMEYPASQFTASDDIAYDSVRSLYTSSVRISGIGVAIGVGPGCYNVFSGQEHFLTVSGTPIVRLYWDEGEQMWKPDGEQIVEVCHETGEEPLPESKITANTKAVCVVDADDPTIYRSLRLIPGTYTVEGPVSGGSGELLSTVTITDFAPYARQLGAEYEVDWDSNLHEQDYYRFYFVRELTTGSIANGSQYYRWTEWKLDNIRTEWQSTGGVKHNEFLNGKELLVKSADVTWTFSEFAWEESADGYSAAAVFTSESGKTRSVAAEVSSSVLTPATCEAAGQTVYTATLSAEQSLDGVEHSDSRTVEIPALGHKWKFEAIAWAEDNTASASFVCENDAGHRQSVAAAVTAETVAPTCETAGRTVYTATLSAEQSLDGAAHSDTKTVEIPALGHKWKFVAIAWAEDNTASASFVCENDASHEQSVSTVVTVETIDPTCETAGRTVYTATLSAEQSLDGAAHSDSRTAEIPATGHKWGESSYTWAADNSTVTAVAVCENDSEHQLTETVSTRFTVITEPAPGQDGKGLYTAVFSNPLFAEQSKETALPAVDAPAALTEAEIAAVGNAVNAIDGSDAASERSFGFLPGTFEVGTMAPVDALHYRTLVSITDLGGYAQAFGEGFYVAEDNPRAADSYVFVFVNTLTGDYESGFAWSGWALDLEESGCTGDETVKGMALRVSDLYTVTYDCDLVDRFGFVYAESVLFDEVADAWTPVQVHYGDPVPALRDDALQSIILFYSGEKGFDGWDPAISEGDVVTADVTYVSKWVTYPDIFRFDYSGTDPYRSKAENMDGALGRLICVTDEGHNVDIPARYWMCLTDGTRSSFAKDGDTWKGTVTFRFNKYQWDNPLEFGGFMAAVVNDGYIAEGHKPVKPMSANAFTTFTVDVTYDYATEKWSASELPEIELYCGYKVVYRDESGSTLFYVPAGAGLPAYEGSTDRDDGLFLGWFDNWNNRVEPGDQNVRVNRDTTITATFLPYPDKEELSNVHGNIFRFLCVSDLDDMHHPDITVEQLADAGVLPNFGEVAVEDMDWQIFSAELSLSNEQIRTVLDYCADRMHEAEMPAFFLREKHDLLEESGLSVRLVFRQESYSPAGGAVYEVNADLPDMSESNLLYGYWGVEDEEAIDEIEIRCAYCLRFMDAEGEEFDVWPDMYIYYYDYDEEAYLSNEELLNLTAYLPANDEELIEFYGGDEEILSLLTKDGLHFAGWVLHDEDGNELPLPALLSGDATLYPSYAADTVTVRFVVDGEEVNALEVNYGESAAEPAQPEKKDCVFLGWFADGAESAYDFSAPVNRDLTLTARFRHNSGWFKNADGKWNYYDENGELYTGWLKTGSATYYLDEDGTMLNGWQEIDGEKYWFFPGGSMKTGWRQMDGAWYYFDAEGRMQTGFVQTYGNYYYMDENGRMLTGWQKLDGRWYYFDLDSGKMAVGWKKLDGTWYYFNSDGKMKTGWLEYNGKWYYLQAGGAMKTGWLEYNGKWYWFDQNGAMAADTTLTIDGKRYRFDASGRML